MKSLTVTNERNHWIFRMFLILAILVPFDVFYVAYELYYPQDFAPLVPTIFALLTIAIDGILLSFLHIRFSLKIIYLLLILVFVWLLILLLVPYSSSITVYFGISLVSGSAGLFVGTLLHKLQEKLIPLNYQSWHVGKVFLNLLIFVVGVVSLSAFLIFGVVEIRSRLSFEGMLAKCVFSGRLGGSSRTTNCLYSADQRYGNDFEDYYCKKNFPDFEYQECLNNFRARALNVPYSRPLPLFSI